MFLEIPSTCALLELLRVRSKEVDKTDLKGTAHVAVSSFLVSSGGLVCGDIGS